ncbi:MAG: hypothetical protein ACM3O6_17165 [Acidobacteriota bacterium]
MSSKGLTAALWLGAAAAVLLPAATARADAIDGNWCYSDGRRMMINGPEIVTPAGTRTIGNYSRHYFSYQVPAADPNAGQSVFMALQNENTVNISTGADAASAAKSAIEVWHRCPPATSSLGIGPGPS